MTALVLLFWLVVIVFVALAVLFGLVILPVWLIMHCAISPRLSVRAKAIWIALMVLCWPFAELAYGAFVADATFLRWSSRFSLATAVVGLIALIGAMPWFLHRASDAIMQSLGELGRLELELSADEQRRLRDALRGLAGDTQLRWTRLNESIMATDLHELYRVMTADRRLTHEEYDDWMTRYRLRGQLERNALEHEIRRRRHASPAPAGATP